MEEEKMEKEKREKENPSCCSGPVQPRFVLATAQLERGHSYRIFGNRNLEVSNLFVFTHIGFLETDIQKW